MQTRLRELLEEMTESLATELHPARLDELSLEVPHGISILPPPFGEPLEDFNCVMFALDLVDTIEDPSGRPFGRFYADTEFLSSLIDTGKIVQTGEVEGALVIWFDNGRVRHVGLARDTGRAASKWGIGHLYEHGHFEIPKSYGNDVRFFEPLDSETAFHLLTRRYGVR